MKIHTSLMVLGILLPTVAHGQGQPNGCSDFPQSPLSGVELIKTRNSMRQKEQRCAGSAEFHFHYGYVLERLSKYDKALPQYLAAIKIDPGPARYYLGAADILRLKEHDEKARKLYQIALEKDPENQWATKMLAQLKKHASSNGKEQLLSSELDRVLRAAPGKAGSSRTPNPDKSIESNNRSQQEQKPRKASAAIDDGVKLASIDQESMRVAAVEINKLAVMLRYDDFYMDRTEISIEQYRQVNAAYQLPQGFTGDLPVVNISYDEARNFADIQGKRLCSADEWRIAATWDQPDLKKMNLYGDFFSTPYPTESGEAGMKVKNLIGNVAEWVSDGNGVGYIGGHYFSATMLQTSIDQLGRTTTSEGRSGKNHVGFRCCMDVL